MISAGCRLFDGHNKNGKRGAVKGERGKPRKIIAFRAWKSREEILSAESFK